MTYSIEMLDTGLGECGRKQASNKVGQIPQIARVLVEQSDQCIKDPIHR
jgi:hypothetical protein